MYNLLEKSMYYRRSQQTTMTSSMMATNQQARLQRFVQAAWEA
jgi:hypothetical protein